MATYINVKDTIEGESVDGWCRKWTFRCLKRHPITRKVMRLYVTDRNCEVAVTKEGKVPSDSAIAEATQSFHRKIGDKVVADALSVWVDMKKSIHIETLHGKEEASHRHGIQYSNIKKHTIATITMPLQNLLRQLGYSNNLLEK